MPLMAAAMLSGVIGTLGGPPFAQLGNGFAATAQLFKEVTATRSELLEPIVYPGTGVVHLDETRSAGGLTLIQGMFSEATELRLLDEGGNVVHRWDADFFAVWPDAQELLPVDRIPQSRFHYITQGFAPAEDGSVVFNFSGLGAVKLDKCSNVVWRRPSQNHHSVTVTEDGNYWIPGHIPIFDTPERYLPRGIPAQQIHDEMTGDAHNYNNTVMLIDDDGKVLKEHSVLEAVYDAELEHAIYASMMEKTTDPTHINDIELVNEATAAKIEGVESGDLMLSLRSMNMITIMDPETGKLKWHQIGPWFRQHDPDITEDGNIEIFNNRSVVVGEYLNDSQIVSLDPASGETTVLHPKGKEDRFYSRIMGAHQKLDNGNRLIVESSAGRVFEVTENGKVVWDYRLPYDDEYASLIAYAKRLPNDFFKGELTCPTQAS